MRKIGWDDSPAILGLTLLAVAPGFTGTPGMSDIQSAGNDPKPLIETVVIASLAVAVTKSWWPLVGVGAYLAFDHMYYTKIYQKGVIPNGGSDFGNVESE